MTNLTAMNELEPIKTDDGLWEELYEKVTDYIKK
jgi:hypothetical protein